MAVSYKNPERKIELAADIESAFRKAGVLETYRDFAYSHQREYNRWIEEAKKPETRQRRIQQSIAMLAQKLNPERSSR